MIKKLLLLVFILNIIKGYSQELVHALGSPNINRFFILNDTLYFSFGDGSSVEFPEGEIRYIDLSDPSFPVNTLAVNFNNPAGIEHKDGLLYVAEFGGNRISTLDLSVSNPSPTTIMQVGTGINDLHFVGDILYFTANANGLVAELDLSVPNPSPSVIETIPVGPGPIGLEYKDGYIYFANLSHSSVERKNVLVDNSPKEIIMDDNIDPNFSRPINLEIDNDYLYVACYYGDKIFRIDLSDPSYPYEEVISLNQALDVRIYNGYLYYMNKNNIYRTLLSTLSDDDFPLTEAKLFPNPVKDVLTISNLEENKNYVIFDNLGRQIDQGKIISPNDKIDVSSYESGIYILSIEGFTKKFIVD